MKRAIILILSIILISCDEQEVSKQDFPIIRTIHPKTNESGATFELEIVQEGIGTISRLGFVWDLYEPNIETSDTTIILDIDKKGHYFKTVNNRLSSGLEYNVRAFAQHGSQTIYGNLVSFISEGSEQNPWRFLTHTSALEGSWDTGYGTSFNDIGYLVFQNSDVYQFDFESNQFSSLAKFPNTGGSNSHISSVSTHDSQFFYSSSNQNLYEFKEGIWSIKDQIPFPTSGIFHGFYYKGKIYFLGNTESHMYDPESETWTIKSPIPDTNAWPLKGVSLNDKAYILALDKSLWEYSFETDQWLVKTIFPGISPSRLFIEDIVSFSTQDKVYFGLASTYDTQLNYDSHLWSYTPDIDTWTEQVEFPIPQGDHGRFYFFGKNKLILGYGFNTDYELWSYDPLKE